MQWLDVAQVRVYEGSISHVNFLWVAGLRGALPDSIGLRCPGIVETLHAAIALTIAFALTENHLWFASSSRLAANWARQYRLPGYSCLSFLLGTIKILNAFSTPQPAEGLAVLFVLLRCVAPTWPVMTLVVAASGTSA